MADIKDVIQGAITANAGYRGHAENREEERLEVGFLYGSAETILMTFGIDPEESYSEMREALALRIDMAAAEEGQSYVLLTHPCDCSVNDEGTQIRGLETGADDYISKPISPKVFLSRVNALFRRVNKPETKKLELNGLTIDPERFMVQVNGQDVVLAKKEFELLHLLALKPGRVFLRNEILNQVWGNEVIVGDRTIDVHIRKIRQKLGIDCITTVKGVGYKFEL